MLINFFKDTPNPDKAVHMFTLFHLSTFILLFIIIYLTIKFSQNIKKSKHEEIIRHTLFIILFISQFSYLFIKWFNGVFEMPLHLCGLSVILTQILLLTKNKKIFDIVFFTGFLGGIVTYIVPDYGYYGFDNIRFYTFYFDHTMIIVIPLYFKYAYNYQITKDSLITSFLFLLITWLFNFILNSFLHAFTTIHTNYMFTHHLPEPLTGLLPDWPIYIFIFGVIAIIFYILTYLLFSEKIVFEKETQ